MGKGGCIDQMAGASFFPFSLSSFFLFFLSPPPYRLFDKASDDVLGNEVEEISCSVIAPPFPLFFSFISFSLFSFLDRRALD